jgi:hypothetical protein
MLAALSASLAASKRHAVIDARAERVRLASQLAPCATCLRTVAGRLALSSASSCATRCGAFVVAFAIVRPPIADVLATLHRITSRSPSLSVFRIVLSVALASWTVVVASKAGKLWVALAYFADALASSMRSLVHATVGAPARSTATVARDTLAA